MLEQDEDTTVAANLFDPQGPAGLLTGPRVAAQGHDRQRGVADHDDGKAPRQDVDRAGGTPAPATGGGSPYALTGRHQRRKSEVHGPRGTLGLA